MWVEAIATDWLAEPSVGAIVIDYRDVTERQFAEDAAERERREKSALLDSAAEGILRLDAGRTVHLHQSNGAALLGYAPHEIQGAELQQLVHHSHANGPPIWLKPARCFGH